MRGGGGSGEHRGRDQENPMGGVRSTPWEWSGVPWEGSGEPYGRGQEYPMGGVRSTPWEGSGVCND